MKLYVFAAALILGSIGANAQEQRSAKLDRDTEVTIPLTITVEQAIGLLHSSHSPEVMRQTLRVLVSHIVKTRDALSAFMLVQYLGGQASTNNLVGQAREELGVQNVVALQEVLIALDEDYIAFRMFETMMYLPQTFRLPLEKWGPLCEAWLKKTDDMKVLIAFESDCARTPQARQMRARVVRTTNPRAAASLLQREPYAEFVLSSEEHARLREVVRLAEAAKKSH